MKNYFLFNLHTVANNHYVKVNTIDILMDPTVSAADRHVIFTLPLHGTHSFHFGGATQCHCMIVRID